MACTYFTITLLILGLALKSATADISCYNCMSTINDKNEEAPSVCSSTSSSTTVGTAADFGCKTSFSYSGGVTTITRSQASTTVANTPNQCISASGGLECTCNSDKCNTQSYDAPRTYKCYQCSSTDHFNNGCGEKLDASKTNSVKTVSGCSACYSRVFVDSDASVTYERGCTRSVNIDDTCDGDENLGGKRCGCTKDLCNSAQSVALKSVSVMGAAVVLFIAKVFF